MLFNSISYFIFLPLVLLSYWVCPRALKKPVLLVASYLFYISWIPKYGILVAALTVVNYLFGIAIDRFRQRSKALLVAGLIANLGCLFYFKYVNFFLTTAVDTSNLITGMFSPGRQTLYVQPFDVILPLGISFFVFEFIHYLADVYKGDKAVVNFVDFALFAAFFPSQIAGPIKRYQDFIEQVNGKLTFRAEEFHAGLMLLLKGLFKKVALADNLAIIVNAGFNPAVHMGTLDAWVASAAFALQVYFDFSGYTDMGRGSALMMGITLPQNFNFPYFAGSIADYWRRWHMSLSSWLRDYLYIPLGGGRNHKTRNLFITMVLCGLWHGAAMHFVVFGAYHGMLLTINHRYDDFVKRHETLKALHEQLATKFLCCFATFAFLCLGYVFFRCDTVSHSLAIWHSMLLPVPSTGFTVELFARSPVLAALALYSCYAALYSLQKFTPVPWLIRLQPARHLGLWARMPIYAGVVAAVVGFAPVAASSFIYFQF